MDIVNIILIALAGLIFGIFCTYLIQWLILNKKLSSANEKVEEIIEDANEKKRVILIDAKEQSIKIRAAGEREMVFLAATVWELLSQIIIYFFDTKERESPV